MPERPTDPESILKALSAPFDAREIKFRPGAVSGNRALALPYVDARVIQDRLDDVLGVTGWQDEYECLPEGSVVCRLRLRIGEEWITKVDVGSQSEQPDGGDRMKSAFSDSLKRAAIKFGIGRYLYRLPAIWADFDPRKKQFVRTPVLPGSARASARSAPPPPAKSEEKSDATPSGQPQGSAVPRDGQELCQRLDAFESKLVDRGLCTCGELFAAVRKAGKAARLPDDLYTWAGEEAMSVAVRAIDRCYGYLKEHPSPAQIAGLDSLLDQCKPSCPKGWRSLRTLPAVASLELPESIDQITRAQYQALLPLLQETARSDRQGVRA